MNFNREWITIDTTLANREEALAYVKFLLSEYYRHEADLDEIEKRIDKIKAKWGLQPSELNIRELRI